MNAHKRLGGVGVGALSFIGMLLFASYYDQVGLTLGEIWLLVLGVPLLIALAMLCLLRHRNRTYAKFDPISRS